MPAENYIVVAAVLLYFGTFAGVVNWVMWYTRKVAAPADAD